MHDDLVQRDFTADAPNQLWLADITEHRTDEGMLYLCVIKDVFSNRIVGHPIGPRMKSRLATTALSSAVARRSDVTGCILHSDHGSAIQVKEIRAHTRPLRDGRIDGPRRSGRRQCRHGEVSWRQRPDGLHLNRLDGRGFHVPSRHGGQPTHAPNGVGPASHTTHLVIGSFVIQNRSAFICGKGSPGSEGLPQLNRVLTALLNNRASGADLSCSLLPSDASTASLPHLGERTTPGPRPCNAR